MSRSVLTSGRVIWIGQRRTHAAEEADENREKNMTNQLLPNGLSAETAAHFQLLQGADEADGTFWDFPVFDCDHTFAGTRRLFRHPERSKKTYAWVSGPDPASTSYNLPTVLEILDSKLPLTVWIAFSELDVWLLHQEGIAAFCTYSLDGVHAVLEVLGKHGVKELHTLPPTTTRERKLAASWKELGGKRQTVQTRLYPLADTTGLLDYLNACRALKKDVPSALFDLPTASKEQIAQWKSVKPKAPEMPTPPPQSSKAKSAPKTKGRAISAAEHADQLLDILREPALEMRLYNDTEDTFLSVMWDGKRETYPLNSTRLKYLLDEICGERLGLLPIDQVFAIAIHRLKAEAMRKGEEKEITPRIVGFGGRLYLDLANKAGEAVEIGDDVEGGWRVIDNPPVVFRRASGTQPLPTPIRNENNAVVWQDFKELFSPGSETNWVLMIGWLFGCLRAPLQPFAGLVVSGQQDAGKTERSKMLRQLIDPNKLILADVPETPRDLFIQAQNRFIQGFDNLSGLQKWQSDALCRVATDGNFATRRLHTDDEEKIFSVKRPMLLNGIDNLLGREDLQRRLIFVHIPRFETGEKKSVRRLWDEFLELHPRVLGALLDAVAVGLTCLHATPEPEVGGGMVDFAQWVVAAESALPWESGEFLTAYTGALEETKRVANDEPFADAIHSLMLSEFKRGCKNVDLPTRDLYRAVCTHAAIQSLDAEDYEREDLLGKMRMRDRAIADLTKDVLPRNVMAFGKLLNRKMDSLRAIGVNCTYTKGKLIPFALEWMEGYPKLSDKDFAEMLPAPPAVSDSIFDAEDED
ncbi:MAG: hypothetical protein JWQ03_3215 [Variovorax sp.]|nr:hypothetical protein [Variovorax sp.]